MSKQQGPKGELLSSWTTACSSSPSRPTSAAAPSPSPAARRNCCAPPIPRPDRSPGKIPWHGGITSELHALGRDLVKEQFTARVLERRGRQGIALEGRAAVLLPEGRSRPLLQAGAGLPAGARLQRARAGPAAHAVVRTPRAGCPADFTLWPVLGRQLPGRGASPPPTIPRTTLKRTEFGRAATANRWVIGRESKTPGRPSSSPAAIRTPAAAPPSSAKTATTSGQPLGHPGSATRPESPSSSTPSLTPPAPEISPKCWRN